MAKENPKKLIIIICSVIIVCIAVAVSLIILLGRKTKQEIRSVQAYSVTFYSDDGSVLLIESVEEHKSATPPVQPEMSYGNIFVKWDKAFSDITSDLNVYPVTKKVTDETNVFALSGAYGQKGSDVIVPFQLCGSVCVSGFDLRIQYDPEVVELLSVFNVDGGIVYNDSEKGVVKLNFVSVENTTADVDICTFKFRIKADNGDIPIKANVINAYAYEGETLYKTDYLTIDSVIYVY